jgi:hypothetical protein
MCLTQHRSIKYGVCERKLTEKLKHGIVAMKNENHLMKYDKNKENRSTKHKNEWNIVKNIRQKLENNNLTLTQADKGKTTVILQKHQY